MNGEAPGAPRPDVPVQAEQVNPQLPRKMSKGEVNALGSAFNVDRVKGWFNREKQLSGIAKAAEAFQKARDKATTSDKPEDQLTPEQKAAGETLMDRYSTVQYARKEGEAEGALEASLTDEQKYLIDDIRAQVLENHAINKPPEGVEYSEGQHTDIVVRKDENGHLIVSVVTGNRGEYKISDDGTEIIPVDDTKPLTVEVSQYDHDPKKNTLTVSSADSDSKEHTLIPRKRSKARDELQEDYDEYLAKLKTNATDVIDSVIFAESSNPYVMTLTPREVAGYNVKVLDIQAKNPPITPEEKKKQDGKALSEVGKLIAEDRYDADNPPTVYAGNDKYREVADRIQFKDGHPVSEESEANEDENEDVRVEVRVAESVDGLTRQRQKEIARLGGAEEGSLKRVDFRRADKGDGVVESEQIDDQFEEQDFRESGIARERNGFRFEDLMDETSVDPAELVMALAPEDIDDLLTADNALAAVQDRIRQIAEDENRSVRDIAREQFAQLLRKELGLDASEDTANVSDQNAPVNTIDVSQAISQGQELSTGQMASILEQNSRTQARDQESTTNPDEEAARAEQLEARMNQLVDRLYPADPASRARETAFNDEDVTNATQFREVVLRELADAEMTDEQRGELADNLLLRRFTSEYKALADAENRADALKILNEHYGDFNNPLVQKLMEGLNAEYPGRPEDAEIKRIFEEGTEDERKRLVESGHLSPVEVAAFDALKKPDPLPSEDLTTLIVAKDKDGLEQAFREGRISETAYNNAKSLIPNEAPNPYAQIAEQLSGKVDPKVLEAYAILLANGIQIPSLTGQPKPSEAA